MCPKTFNPSRSIRWVASVDPANRERLEELERRMTAYYQRGQYYADIVEGTELWADLANQPLHRDIVEQVAGRRVLEIGCGRSRILTTGRVAPADYAGTDFSAELMRQNAAEFPAADFRALEEGGHLPFEDGAFDAVFSVFVLEHAVFPQRFLEESVRVLRPGGVWILLCPDFLGRDRMTSQRVGFSLGSGKEKLRKGRPLDAVLTSYDQRCRVPRHCARCREKADRTPRFFVNLAPVCFVEDEFRPDVDAVYLTYAPEIRDHLKTKLRFHELPSTISETAERRRLIYLRGTVSGSV